MILFLDFDGPLFNYFSDQYKDELYPYNKKMLADIGLHPMIMYWKMQEEAVEQVNKMTTDSAVQLVISSSWGDSWLHDKEHIDRLLVANGLSYTLHQNWRTPRDDVHTRGGQIQLWLEQNPGHNEYIILDDPESAKDLLYFKTSKNKNEAINYNLERDNIFLCDSKNGFSKEQWQQVLTRAGELIAKSQANKKPLLSKGGI